MLIKGLAVRKRYNTLGKGPAALLDNYAAKLGHAMFFCRITGAKGDRNIHASVSEQLKKNFAKSRWKVRSRTS